jgi:adhesin transport system membrane fusion protein
MLTPLARKLRLDRLFPVPAPETQLADPYKNYTFEDDQKLAQDFVSDAQAAVLAQDPLRIRFALKATFWMAVAFLIWAAVAKVDEQTKGEGKVIPSRQLQVVQSLDGGIVSEILVREGDTVQAGATLLRIDPTRFISGYRENRATYLSLLAKAAQLEALAEGKSFVPPPEVLKEDPELAAQEQSLYRNRKAELDGQIDIARVQLQQRSQELAEVRARYESASQGLELTSRELKMTKPLVQSGAVSDVDLIRLERDVTRYSGEKNQMAAQIGRLQGAISEAQSKLQSVELEFKNRARTELAEVQSKINSLSESSVALSDKVKQADLRAPVTGTVQRLFFNTVGGVVPAGKAVVEIVPQEDKLILEAKISPRDIAFLRPGQAAKVKFTAYDFSIYGSLDGTLEHISADTVIDERGNAYYLVRVRTEQSSLGDNLPIIPGMLAEVDILTGKKSILSYLLKPVLRAKARALTER